MLLLTAKAENQYKTFWFLLQENSLSEIESHTLPCSVGFLFSQLTSVNNFQLVPIDSPAALSPLLLVSETDESRGELEMAGTEEQNSCNCPQSRQDVPVGQQEGPSGVQRAWKLIEVIQVFYISILNSYT